MKGAEVEDDEAEISALSIGWRGSEVGRGGRGEVRDVLT